MLVDPEQVARIAAKRRDIAAREARRGFTSGEDAAGIGEVNGTCRYCRQPFTYESPVMRFPTGQVVPLGGPRIVCHGAECTATFEAEREAERLAEYERMQSEALERRRLEYTKWVPPIYHREARIAPASTKHLVPELEGWDERESLYIDGPSSSGKSHQVAALMHLVAGRVSMEWYSTRHLLADAQTAIGSKGKIEMPGIIGDPTRCKVLVLNDVFAEATTRWAATTIGTMIDKRYEQGQAIVFTSNVAIDEIGATAEGSRHDVAMVRLELARIAERILEMTTPPYGRRVTLDARNWRHALAAGEVKR